MATFIEPLWVSIIRVLSILMPMEELRRGNSKFKASVGANYVSLPPQLLFVRALRSRQFLLSMTCVMALLSSLLAVAFSGLFQQVTIAQGIQTPMKHSFLPFLQSVGLRGSVDASQENSGMLNLSFVNANTHWDYVDPFYVVDANITRGLSLPPWTTSDYYFVSFDVDKLPANADGSRSAVTQGFGIDVPCITSDHSSNYGNVSFEVDISSDGQNNLTTSHVMGNGSRYDCHSRYTLFDDSGGVALRFQVQANPAYLPLSRPEKSGPHAVETVIGMTATSNLKMTPTQEQAATCAQEIAVAWFRADFTEQANQAVPSMSNERSLLLMCYPRLKIAQFEVSVDSSGGVTSYAQTGPFVADTTSYYDGPAPRALTDTIALLHGTIGDVPNWHSDTAAYDWLNYFIKIKTNSSDITDPLKPLPDPTKISPLIEDIVRRVFTSSLSLNQNATFKLMDTQQVIDGIGALHGTIWVQVDRWVISELMFTIALTILILMLLVAVAVFVWRPARFLPRIPTSIASQMAYFASSSIMGDMRRMDQSSRPQEKEMALKSKQYLYGYGKFVGLDHKPHVGIERAPYYTPLEGQLRRRTGSRFSSGKGVSL